MSTRYASAFIEELQTAADELPRGDDELREAAREAPVEKTLRIDGMKVEFDHRIALVRRDIVPTNHAEVGVDARAASDVRKESAHARS